MSMTCFFFLKSEHNFVIFIFIHLKLELDSKYQNQTCGLCGNFNGMNDDFMKSGEYRKKGKSTVHECLKGS